MYRFIVALLLCLSGYASAHEWTPTYPKLEQAPVDKVLVARMKLFNSRKDVLYFEINVKDSDMNAVPFATPQRIVRIDYLDTKYIPVYIREQDVSKATYICSKSKIIVGSKSVSSISSRICSKIK
jgi:hypothetical protein